MPWNLSSKIIQATNWLVDTLNCKENGIRTRFYDSTYFMLWDEELFHFHICSCYERILRFQLSESKINYFTTALITVRNPEDAQRQILTYFVEKANRWLIECTKWIDRSSITLRNINLHQIQLFQHHNLTSYLFLTKTSVQSSVFLPKLPIKPWFLN